MSEKRDRGTRDFSKYDTMATEDLEEILRLDAETPEGWESDTELLLYVMGVLADRKRNSNSSGYTAYKAFESFQQNYLSCDDEADDATKAVKKTSRKSTRWLRGLSAAAAVFLVMFCCSFAAQAFGRDIWDVVVTWAQETFHFSGWEQAEISEPSPNDNAQYESLQQVLTDAEIDTALVPTWIPEGYELVEIIIDETPAQEAYIAFYRNGEKNIRIAVCSYINSDPEQIEKSDDFAEVYEVLGIDYYIFSNNSQNQATWINGNYECIISGAITVEQLKLMINSIRNGE